MAMPNRYSDVRLMTMASLKHNLVAAAAKSYQVARFKNPDQKTWTWEELAEYWPARARFNLEKDTAAFTHTAKRKREESPPPPSLEDEASDDQESSGASSGSDSDDSVSDFDDPPVEWSLSRGQKGHLHLHVEGGLACCRTLSLPEQGSGIRGAWASGRQWSPRCQKALPPRLAKWWDAQSTSLIQ